MSDTRSNPSRTPVPRQTGQVFQYQVGQFFLAAGDGVRQVWNESVGVEGRYTTCQKGSVQVHEERNLYGTKTIIHAQIKEILRLKYQHQLSVRAIARSCGLSRS